MRAPLDFCAHRLADLHMTLTKKLSLPTLTIYLLSVVLVLTILMRLLEIDGAASLERKDIGVKLVFASGLSVFVAMLMMVHARFVGMLLTSLLKGTFPPDGPVSWQGFPFVRAVEIGWMIFFLIQAVTQPIHLLNGVVTPPGLDPTDPTFGFTLLNYGVVTPLLETLVQCCVVLTLKKFVKNTTFIAFVVGVLAAIAHGYVDPMWGIAGFIVFFFTTLAFLSQATVFGGLRLAFLCHATNNFFGCILLVGVWSRLQWLN